MKLTRSATLALSIVASTSAVLAQAPPRPAGTGLVIGQVVDATTGRPLQNAAVIPTLVTKESPFGRQLTATATDADGHFVLRELPAGSITIGARRGGYLDGWYGAADPTGASRPIELGDAGRLGGLTIRLWPNATIGGAVVDERGEPIVDLTVQALKRTLIAGHWRIGEGYAFLHTARTDDRGEYRITDLPPGDYIVVIANTIATAPSTVIANVDRLREANGSSPEYRAASATLFAIGAPISSADSRALTVGDFLAKVDNPSMIRASGDGMPLDFPTP
jgi:hypothetical protein